MTILDEGDPCQQVEILQRKNKLLEEGLHQAERLRHMLMATVDELKSAKSLLTKRTEELNEINVNLSTIYRVSSAILKSRNLNDLCDEILKILAEIVPVLEGYESGIFLVEGDAMRLIASLGEFASKLFVDAHKDMQVGHCLCGWVAQTGEVFTTEYCRGESRKTINYQASRPHGHAIIPFKAKDRVVAVYFCYIAEHTRFSPQRLRIFQAIGDQLGIAFENARLYDENEFLSLHDPLTGLANRRCMEFTMAKAVEQAKRYDQPLSVIMADIDHFKQYNDTHGHRAGDELLVAVARLIAQEIRAADLAVRYGGEEFLILLPMADIDHTQEVAERIRKSIDDNTIVTLSLGITFMRAPDCSAEHLIRNADEALYRAKQNGRNQVKVHL